MKRTFLLIFCIIFLFLDSCKEKKGGTEIPPDVNATRIYMPTLVTDKSDLAMRLYDDEYGETVNFWGTKNSDGLLTKLQSITFSYDKFKTVIEVKVTEDKTIAEIGATYDGKKRIIKFSDYDFVKNTVSVEIVDETQKVLEPRRTANIPSDLVEDLKDLKSSKFSNGRVTAICDWFTAAKKWITVIKCFFKKDWKFQLVCVAVGAVGTPAAAVICEDLLVPYLVWKCHEEVIEIQEYYKECYPNPEPKDPAQSTGDPHILTLDGYKYDFQGFGEFIVSKSTEDNFEIQARQGGGQYATMNYALAINTGTDIVSFHTDLKSGKLFINGKATDLPTQILSLQGGASIKKGTSSVLYDYRVQTTKGDIVDLSLRSVINYRVSLISGRAGKVKGILGNFDGNRSNDLVTSTGEKVDKTFEQLYPKFSDSWRVKENSLFYYEQGTNTETFTKRDLPKKLSISQDEIDAAAKVCDNAGVTGEPYRSNCIYDVAVMRDPEFAQWYKVQTSSSVAVDNVENDISMFKNVVLTASDLQGTLTDSCLISYSTGQVFQLKDGAANANKIDALVYSYCGLTIAPPSYVKYCNGSCGNSRLLNVIENQKWSSYRSGAADTKLGDDNPYSSQNISASEWSNIKSSGDLANLSWEGATSVKADNYQFGSRIGFATSDSPLGLCIPNYFFTKTLYRFITKEGKKGVFKINGVTRTATGWRIIIDIKIQK